MGIGRQRKVNAVAAPLEMEWQRVDRFHCELCRAAGWHQLICWLGSDDRLGSTGREHHIVQCPMVAAGTAMGQLSPAKLNRCVRRYGYHYRCPGIEHGVGEGLKNRPVKAAVH